MYLPRHNKHQAREWMASLSGSISRTLLRKTLQTDAEFQYKMRVYIDEAQVQWDTMAMDPTSKVPRRWDATDAMHMPTPVSIYTRPFASF